MAKPKNSMTHELMSERDYPSSMRGLIDSEGHISLDASDYIYYSQDEVESFLASLPYESHVLFSPEGDVLSITSSWLESSVTYSPLDVHNAIRFSGDGFPTGDGYVDFHTHPYSDVFASIGIFSYGDISVYEDMLARGIHGRSMYPDKTPNKFRVRSYDGSTFELEFVGDRVYNYKNDLQLQYINEWIRAEKSAATISDPDENARAISLHMDRWLKENAASYGFDYRSTLR